MNILLNKATAEKYGAKYVVIAGDIVMARDDKVLPKRLSDRPYVPVFRGKWTIEEA